MVLFPSKAIVKAKINGSWTAEIEYPIDDEGRWRYIEDEAVVELPSFNGNQLFRIKQKGKSDSGIAATLEPIFFDAKNDCFLTDVRPTNQNGQQALDIMCQPNSKYKASSNISKVNSAYYEYMNLLEALNGKQDNAFTKRWGGELLFDNFTVVVNEKIGGDYGVELRYGKNIPEDGMIEEVDTSKVVTRIYPKSFNGHKLSTGYVDSPLINNYPIVKCAEVRFEEIKLRKDIQEGEETKGLIICDDQAQLDAELTKKCKEQFEQGIDKPSVTIEADMELLQNTEQYEDYKLLETVSLGDVVHCKNEYLNIITDERVIELEYDCILEKVNSVVLGTMVEGYFNKVSNTINKVEGTIRPNGTIMAEQIQGILNAMKTQLKYQKDIAHKQDVRAILFEDLDIDSPTYGAMCLGTQGFQISNRRTADGRDWDWRTAGTANGFNADTVITGKLTDKTGKNYWDLDTGDFQLAGVGGDQTNWQNKIDQAQQNAIQESAKALQEYANTVSKDFETMQKQVDGQVEDWYYDYEPTSNNAPASAWTTEKDKQKHEGDRFFWKSKGYAYRWMRDGNTWKWVLLKDTDITKAMQTAAEAKDTADSKRRTFITQPVSPYDVGDLWMDGTDVLTCTTSRLTGSYFSKTDWKKLNTYTDDTVANEALGNSQNPDRFLTQQQVFNKLTNNGVMKGIFMRDGELYINATYLSTGILTDSSGKNSWNLDTGELNLEKFDLKVAAQDEAIREAQILIGKNAESINTSVQRVEENANKAIDAANRDIREVSSRVDQTMTADQVRWEIQKKYEQGAEKVTTKTGMTFDDSGLNIDKEGAPTKTNINENGMRVSENGQTVLTANNQGVDARNLHATTYLIIGNNSRFEDYDTNRTACFWIGD